MNISVGLGHQLSWQFQSLHHKQQQDDRSGSSCMVVSMGSEALDIFVFSMTECFQQIKQHLMCQTMQQYRYFFVSRIESWRFQHLRWF